MTKVSGIFDSKIEAESAVSALLSSGFDKDDISIITTDKARDKFFNNSTDVEGNLDATNQVAKGGATGALLGGTLGAIVAGLTAVGSIAIPGAGLLVAGPIVAILSGAGAGAATGGLAGVLVGAGFGVDEANRYEQELKQGKILIVVDAGSEAERATAQKALGNFGATIKAA